MESMPNTFGFGTALMALKEDAKVAREGWNGKDMFLYYVRADFYPAKSTAIKGFYEQDMVPYGAYIAMKTATGEVVPWLASQTDILANDWKII